MNKRDLETKKREVKKKIQEMTEFSKKKWGVDVVVRRISYKLDTEVHYGEYCPNFKVIALNPDLLGEYGKIYIDDVVVHEFVHALVDSYFPSGYNGKKRVGDHGKEFKAFCSHFGNDGKATTGLFRDSKTKSPTPSKRNFTMIDYECSCMIHSVTKIKHNRMVKGQIRTCRHCATPLKLKETN